MRPHIMPTMHAIANAIANPYVPSHIPPATISFMSPIPIGAIVSVFLCIVRSNRNPIIAASAYPPHAATAASGGVVGHG